MTGDTVLGALYVSDIEVQYQQLNIAVILSLLTFSSRYLMVVAILIADRLPNQLVCENKLAIARGDYSGKLPFMEKMNWSIALTFNQLAEQIEETQDAMESEKPFE